MIRKLFALCLLGALTLGGLSGEDGADGADELGVDRFDPPTLSGHQQRGTILAYDVQAAFNDDTFFWHVSYRGNEGKRYEYIRYTGGAWQREGGPRRDSQASIDNDTVQGDVGIRSTIYEQRTSIMVSDPNIEPYATEFDKFGCFLTCHDQNRNMPDWASASGHDTKWVDPSHVTGYVAGAADKVLDLWHWRAARSNPIARADDQYIHTRVFADSTSGDDGGRKGDGGAW